MTAVKFCGLRRTEDVEACNRLLPEYAGFVFWKRSRRFLISLQLLMLLLHLQMQLQKKQLIPVI